MNVWGDGRFHLERRTQRLPNPTATIQVYESTLSENQFRQLRSILDSDSIRKLQPFKSLDNSRARTWVRGMRARIVRDTFMQDVGYFEWGGRDVENRSDVTEVDDTATAAALKPLEEWLNHVNTAKLGESGGEPDLCGDEATD